MPNPAGFNGVDPVEPGYGERKQMGAMQKSAPLAGQAETAHATNTPRRGQKQAIRGSEQQGPPPQLPGEPAQIAPQAQVAMFWQQIAQLPGASPLVKQIAQEAAGGNQTVSAPLTG